MERLIISSVFMSFTATMYSQTIINYRKVLSTVEKSRAVIGNNNGSLLNTANGTIHNLRYYDFTEKN
jgi:hypothetical protein